IRKELRGPDAPRRLWHEIVILQRLAGVKGVPQLVGEVEKAESTKNTIKTDKPYEVRLLGRGEGERTDAILLEDTEGRPLAEATPLKGCDLTAFALALARVVARVHRRGVVHKNINPGNIIISGPKRRPMLIDFGLATTFAEDRPEFTPT